MRLLVLGCGSIGRRHALSAGQLGFEVTVADTDGTRAQAVARETDAVAWHDDAKAALATRPDAVIVATPHVWHVEHAKAALDHDAHVLIEKPVSDRLDGLDELAAMAARRGKGVFVVCNMRYHKAVEALWNNRGALGTVRYARAHYGNYLPSMRPGTDYRNLYCSRAASGGGVILDAIHEIDYLMWFFGPVSRVAAEKGRLSDLDIDVEDFADIVLEHASGVRSVITMDYLRPCKRRGCEIIGQDGMLIWDSEGKQPERCEVRLYRTATARWEVLLRDEDLDLGAPYLEMMKDFTTALAGRPSRLQTLGEAKTRLEAALAARGTGGVVA
jgi:predicted dehydrogenase